MDERLSAAESERMGTAESEQMSAVESGSMSAAERDQRTRRARQMSELSIRAQERTEERMLMVRYPRRLHLDPIYASELFLDRHCPYR